MVGVQQSYAASVAVASTIVKKGEGPIAPWAVDAILIATAVIADVDAEVKG